MLWIINIVKILISLVSKRNYVVKTKNVTKHKCFRQTVFYLYKTNYKYDAMISCSFQSCYLMIWYHLIQLKSTTLFLISNYGTIHAILFRHYYSNPLLHTFISKRHRGDGASQKKNNTKKVLHFRHLWILDKGRQFKQY
jgi:hypothetical protein